MVQLNLQNEKGMKRLNQMEKKKNKEKKEKKGKEKEKNKEKKEKKEKVKRERFEMNVVLVMMKLNSKNLEWINPPQNWKRKSSFFKKKLFIFIWGGGVGGEDGENNKIEK